MLLNIKIMLNEHGGQISTSKFMENSHILTQGHENCTRLVLIAFQNYPYIQQIFFFPFKVSHNHVTLCLLGMLPKLS